MPLGTGSIPIWDFMAATPDALLVVELDDTEVDMRRGRRAELRLHHRRAPDASASGPVGVGIIGAGVISSTYIENLNSFADTELLAIGDLYPEMAASQGRRVRRPLPAATCDTVLNHPDVEIVVNLTHPAVHTEVARQAIAAGKHVWSEKPLALDLSQRARSCSTRRRLPACGSAARPTPFSARACRPPSGMLASGAIGTPLTALFLMQQPGPDRWHPNPAFLFQEGAGPVFDIGPYYLTALVQMFGPVDVRGRGGLQVARDAA